MRHRVSISLVALAVAVAGAAPAAALAQTDPNGSTAASPVEGASAPVAESPFGGGPVADEALQRIAGREDLNQIAQSRNTSTVANNSVGNNSTTGDARIADNAFQNLSGLSLLNVNTGNNVSINASMNVTIAISPGQ